MSSKLIRMLHATIIATFLMLLTTSAHADVDPTTEREVQTILHMLNYLSVDYGVTVLFSKVVNEKEYKEQTEFAGQSVKLLAKLPENPDQAKLVKEAQELVHQVQAKASADQVSAIAQQLRKKIIAAYRVSVSPLQIPNLQQAVVLYQLLCVSCHGAEGRGDGPDGETLTPKPANFHNTIRMGKLSIYGLYNTITLGVAGTSMVGYPQLSDDERWALAFFVSNFQSSPERLSLGQKFWGKREFQGPVPNLGTLTTLTANEVSVNYGDKTRAVFEYLRTHPQALGSSRQVTLIFATEQLEHALTSYRTGDKAGAIQYAIASYLEGFEPMEISLGNLNAQLRLDIEREMMEARQLIYSDAPAESLAIKIQSAKSLLTQADELLREGKLTINGTFFTSFLILLREGLEALLVLSVVTSLVVRGRQRNSLTFLYAGWSGAFLLGIFTWVMATWLIEITGVEREFVLGFGALIISFMLIYVVSWLYDKTHAHDENQILANKVYTALGKKTLWILSLISFFAVYREIFESVVFYQALWAQTSDVTRTALWGGIFTASLTLLAVGWAMSRFCLSLSLRAFFFVTSMLLAGGAVIFVGKGVESLQESGLVAVNHINFLPIPMLGIFPTTQTLAAQLAVIGILILSYRFPNWRRPSNQNRTPS